MLRASAHTKSDQRRRKRATIMDTGQDKTQDGSLAGSGMHLLSTVHSHSQRHSRSNMGMGIHTILYVCTLPQYGGACGLGSMGMDHYELRGLGQDGG